MNGRDKIPEKAWRDERDKLLAQRFAHVEEYYQLKDAVRNIELLRKGAENIMREQLVIKKAQEMEI